MQVGIKRLDEGAHGRGLAGADIASDESRVALGEGEGQTGLDFLVGGGGEEVAHRDGLVER